MRYFIELDSFAGRLCHTCCR